MPILIPKDTAAALGPDAARCESRSLFADKFADPGAEKADRQKWFDAFIRKQPARIAHAASRFSFGGVAIYAQLQSRLMVNMGGGVMENAGLCLDRFGMPYIPGSAVKGCARRLALAALREWTTTKKMPNPESPFHSACEPFNTPAEMLSAIAQTFGWTEADWKEESDFFWACDRDKAFLGVRFLDLNFSGSVSFLPAHVLNLSGTMEGLPLPLPRPGTLELDVVTSHHRDYYQGLIDVAEDTEDPIPVFFPAVAAGHVFSFTLLPLRRNRLRSSTDSSLDHARLWLAEGLRTFGLGAKTNAGYGWFDSSPEIQKGVMAALHSAEERRRAEKERQQREAREKAEQEERSRKRQEEKAAIASMSDDEKEDYKLDTMNEHQLLQYIEKFDKRSQPEREAVYRMLTGRNVDLWRELRQKSESGKAKEKKRFTPVVQALFAMAKHKKEKMPK